MEGWDYDEWPYDEDDEIFDEDDGGYSAYLENLEIRLTPHQPDAAAQVGLTFREDNPCQDECANM
jgi:hypothetical protein